MPVSIPALPPEHIGIIDPKKVYLIGSFYAVAGIGLTTVRNAKHNGIELCCLQAGRRKWVKGSDGIAFLESLAAHSATSKEAK